MKKVARLRMPADEPYVAGYNQTMSGAEQVGVRTTGRIKKPKAVFDPSDNYLPRSQRLINMSAHSAVSTVSVSAPETVSERRKLSMQTISPDALQSKKPVRLLSAVSPNPISVPNPVTSCSPAENVEICSVCLKREAKRGTYAKNKIISCLDCDKKVHKLCLKLDFEDLETLRQNYKCENCRSCDVCAVFSEFDSKYKELVTCTKCVKSYHLNCHIPSVLKYQQYQRNWKCNKCTLPVVGNGTNFPVKNIREIIGGNESLGSQKGLPIQSQDKQQLNINIAAAAAQVKNVASVACKRGATDIKTTGIVVNGTETIIDNECQGNIVKKPRYINNKDNEDKMMGAVCGGSNNINRYSPNEPMDLPDVKDWNVEQVVEFFTKYFPNEAHVFKEQEIDGMSLLLLKRSDVIKKLPIKLGPSLRIYSLILKIQTQLNDPTLGWNCSL